jgi:integrase
MMPDVASHCLDPAPHFTSASPALAVAPYDESLLTPMMSGTEWARHAELIEGDGLLPANHLESSPMMVELPLTLDAPAERRALELDALAAILPIDRRDQLARLLTDDEIATLKHLAAKGMGENTLRALTSDLGYLEAWAQAATGEPLPWPAPPGLVLKFIAHHLWDPAEKSEDDAHGMPDEVQIGLRGPGILKKIGPHAPSTVQRRLASWGTLHGWRGLPGHLKDPTVKSALKLALRASRRPCSRKSERAVTLDILDRLVATCPPTNLIDIRDKALLYTAFASGGRRRSEVAALHVSQLRREPPVLADPNDANSAKLPCLSIRLGTTKTENADVETRVLLIGKPVDALNFWLQIAQITEGPVFRGLGRWGQLQSGPLTPKAVNDIVKRRCRLARLDPAEFSAHGLRSGYITEAASQGVSILDTMQQSTHRSVQQVARYFNEVRHTKTKAARLAT